MAVAAGTAEAASLYDPLLRFRMLPTEHFVIYFHQGEEALAQRLAGIVEDTWRALDGRLDVRPPKRTHVVLVDQTELANGWASPIPYDTVMVTAAWPAGSEFIGSTDDWLRIVFTHEFTHILHLDRSEGWARVVRGIFGRMQIAFPNLFLPRWQLEGLATYHESVIAGEGRLHAGDFRAVVDEAARADRLAPLDRVNGGLTSWPNGDGEYAYGLGFHQYLADRFGAATLGQLSTATSRRLPYTGSAAFKKVYGQPLGRLWDDYQQSLPRGSGDGGATDLPNAKRLTHHDFDVSGPRFDRRACATCPLEVVYSLRSPEGFPTMNRVALDGSEPRPMTRRFLGSTTAIGDDGLYFDQQDLRRNTGLYSDLYVWSRQTGRVRRITSDARLIDPDLSPDGSTLVAVQDKPGQRDLVMIRLKPDPTETKDRFGASVGSGFSRTITIETLVTEPETQFNTPRWSPDGRTIAVERHRLGSLSDVVLVDVATRTVRSLTGHIRGRSVTPAWRPDGRAVVAAVALEEQPFNLHEFTIDGNTERPLTVTAGGAKWPDISPDGQTIVFVGYTATGFDLFTMPYPEDKNGSGLMANGLALPSAISPQPSAISPSALTRVDAYSPWPTLPPTSWWPEIDIDSTQTRLGASVSGYDVLGYHGYSASATWLVSGPSGAPKPHAATPDWDISYAYARWRPTLWATASNSTSFFSGPATEAGTPTDATLRERQLEAGVTLPIRHVRTSHLALASILRSVDEYTLTTRRVTRDRTALRGGWASSTAHTYGYSVSPEGGLVAGVTAESVPEALGSFATATAVTADLRAYLPGLARHHVFAIRAAGGVSNGDPDVRRTFHLGGAEASGNVLDFGRNAVSLLRGFAADTFAGSRVALVNADYRFPIARPQRGYGTWPLFIHTIHAAIVADAGHAWTRTFRSRDIKTSAGVELAARMVAGYFFPFVVATGVAWGHDGSGTFADRATTYVRVGYAF